MGVQQAHLSLLTYLFPWKRLKPLPDTGRTLWIESTECADLFLPLRVSRELDGPDAQWESAVETYRFPHGVFVQQKFYHALWQSCEIDRTVQLIVCKAERAEALRKSSFPGKFVMSIGPLSILSAIWRLMVWKIDGSGKPILSNGTEL